MKPYVAPKPWIEVARELRLLRRERGIGVRQLAEAIGIDRRYVWDVETARRKPSGPVLGRWLCALEADPSVFGIQPLRRRRTPLAEERFYWRARELAQSRGISFEEARDLLEERERAARRRRLERLSAVS